MEFDKPIHSYFVTVFVLKRNVMTLWFRNTGKEYRLKILLTERSRHLASDMTFAAGKIASLVLLSIY